MVGTMRYTTLIGTDDLARGLNDPSLVIVDCRFDLRDTSAGERAYEASHIPGAVYAHLDRDLSGTKTGTNGRHPLPGVTAAANTFGRWGIEATAQVVAYDQDSGGFASRLWWMLRWLGHDAVAVLDGGFAKWTAGRRPTRAGVETRTPRSFVPRPRPEMVVTAADVAGHDREKDWRLLDARAPERFSGEVEPIDKVAGHIPGAVNLPFLHNLNSQGTFRSSADLEGRFRAAIGAASPDHVVCYCGSGVTACQNVLALEHAGLHGAKLYAGSWSEWSSDPSRPVERTK
jgi:thiosulfate/3-mercaptopyruvate sulfurtransferase